jgi:hypothetical protein
MFLRYPLISIVVLLSLASPALAAPYFVQCFDFGCKTTRELHYTPADWQSIEALFGDKVTDAASEKQAIRRAVALMERISGELSGTRLDRGGNYPGADIPQQMDCIDESTNTYQYLSALQQLDLLRWHQVDRKYRRIVWFATHWSASIREIGSEQVFVVDSWYRDNGELPFIQPLADWQRKQDFPEALNPELAAN